MPPLPPIRTDDWDQHQTDQYDRTTQDALGSIATARAAQEQADAAQEMDFTQRAQAQITTALTPAREAEEGLSFTQQAQEQVRALTRSVPQVPATGQYQDANRTPTARRSYGQGAEQHRGAIQAAFGDLGPDVVENFLGIVERESGGNPGARKNDAIEDSVGIGQVNQRVHPQLAQKYDLNDPAQNARAMREIYDQQGYKAWFNASKQLGLLDGGNLPASGTDPRLSADRVGPDAASTSTVPRRVEAVGQFEQGLPDEDAFSICGPVAALAFAQANGRNPDLGEARRLAKQVGWTSAGGMNGVANEQALLERMGVKARLDTNPDFGQIAQDADSGNPVIISTPRHYYFINAYNRETGQLHVGKTGEARKGGGSWMSAQQIADLDGGINGALFVDNPNSHTPSVATLPDKSIGPADQGIGGGIEKGYTGQPDAVVDEPSAETDPITPENMLPPANTLLRTPFGPMGATAPLPINPAKPVRPSDETTQALAEGKLGADQLVGGGASSLAKMISGEEPLDFSTPQATVGSIVKIVRAATDTGEVGRFLGKQGEALPANVGQMFHDEDAAAQGVRRAEALGASPGGVGGSVRAAESFGGGASDDLAAGLAHLERAHVPVPRKLAEEASTAPSSSTVFARFWNRARNVIEAQGEAGKELGQKLRDWRDSAETLAGEWTAGMPTVRSLSPGEFREFVAAAEGKVVAGSDRVRKAVEEWDGVRTDAYNRAKEAGLDIGHLEGYFPHMFEDGTFQGKSFSDAIDHLVQTGQADTRAAAAQKLRYVADVRRDRRYGNLEAERELDLPFYRRDKGVLFGQGGYLESAANRIAQVAHFGQKDEGALALIDRISQEGFDHKATRALYDVSVGATKYDADLRRVSGALRGANTVMSLGLSAITNAGQFANTATVAGLGPTVKNAFRALRSPEAKEAAIRAGVTLDNVVQDVREGTGLASRALGRITAPGFGTVERFNRTLAFHAGISYAEDMAAAAARGDRGARTALERLGLDAAAVAERGVLSEAEKTTAGRRMVERTQFKVDPQDLPQWASHPVGKVFAQFKTFSYNQSAFLAREIIQPALRMPPDLRPLTRFMVAGLAAGAATTETRNVIQRREPEQDPVKRILQYYQAAGGLGLVGDVLRITSPILNINADRLDPDRVVTQAVGTVLGPTVGTGIEALSGVAQATRGNPTPLLRSGTRRIPVVGTTVQNLLFPYKPRPQSSDIPPGRGSARPPAPPRPPSPPKAPRPGGR